MPQSKVTFVPVESAEKAEWADKDHLLEVWQGLSKSTLTAWLTECENVRNLKKVSSILLTKSSLSIKKYLKSLLSGKKRLDIRVIKNRRKHAQN